MYVNVQFCCAITLTSMLYLLHRANKADQAPRPPCSEAAIREFVEGVNTQLWRSNALMVANAILVAIMVAAGTSGRRYGYRHAAVTRLLFLGASTLYLPIISYVASSIGKESPAAPQAWTCTATAGPTCPCS